MIELKPYFISCKYDHVSYMRGDKVNNYPINISLCTHFHRTQLRWYPDNTGLPAIRFFVGADKIEWAYKEDEDREEDYFRILNLFKCGK